MQHRSFIRYSSSGHPPSDVAIVVYRLVIIDDHRKRTVMLVSYFDLFFIESITFSFITTSVLFTVFLEYY
ncbi:hypothetical protein [secondary endosymbiont of Heteropsylla cubana]|uniref:hypothetical protein n=1 Tax=secondary endosymbiont of Heteropsylla cubana TaxID=134287 RepID=UPI00135CE900|nr:hypothetical protein [secondary endosymbiont of Heteropsylla cubana]